MATPSLPTGVAMARKIDGFIEVADREQWEVTCAANYTATPSGTATDAVVEAFWADVRTGRPAIRP